ncbi:MAG: hypothetical protein AB7E29_14140 [Xanthobacter sp.]
MNTKIEAIALNHTDLEAVNGGIDWARKIQGVAELGRGLMAAAEAKGGPGNPSRRWDCPW